MSRPVKVDILIRKEKEDEKDKAKQIQKIILAASQQINKPVDINITSDFRAFEHISVNVAETPIIIMNDICEFSRIVPSFELIKQRLLATGGAAEIW